MDTLTPKVVSGLTTHQTMQVTFLSPLHKLFGLGRDVKQAETVKENVPIRK